MALDVLSPDRAIDLLARIVGSERIDQDPGAAAEFGLLFDGVPPLTTLATAVLALVFSVIGLRCARRGSRGLGLSSAALTCAIPPPSPTGPARPIPRWPRSA